MPKKISLQFLLSFGVQKRKSCCPKNCILSSALGSEPSLYFKYFFSPYELVCQLKHIFTFLSTHIAVQSRWDFVSTYIPPNPRFISLVRSCKRVQETHYFSLLLLNSKMKIPFLARLVLQSQNEPLLAPIANSRRVYYRPRPHSLAESKRRSREEQRESQSKALGMQK